MRRRFSRRRRPMRSFGRRVIRRRGSAGRRRRVVRAINIGRRM